LLRKELRQLRRSRGALLSSTLLPVLLLVVTPAFQLFSLREAAAQGISSGAAGASTGPIPPELLEDPQVLFARFLFPLFMTLGGLVVPSVAATYTVVAERELRSLELLLSLPVRVYDILAAKLLAMLLLAGGVVLPLFVLDAAAMLSFGLVGLTDILMLLIVLVSALAYAVGEALLLALLARDLRTAQNLNGALLLPVTVLAAIVLLVTPSPFEYATLAGVLLVGAVTCVTIGLRWLTVERYLA
jgi:ABC-type Na+ efflux pump permease subunit